MNKEDIKFLADLRKEMLTQDTVGQASPRFWVIRQQEKEYWVDENTDGIFIFDGPNCETLFEGEFGSDEFGKWFIEFVEEETGEKLKNVDYGYDLSFEFREEEFYITDNKELEEFIEDYCGIESSIGYYRINSVIKENTMFLTKREAEEHLEANSHHYNNTAHTYAMTAWRSPQVERLFKILENTEWESEMEK